MDSRVSCTLCSGNGWFPPVLRDIWVPNSLTYCPTSQESCTPTPFPAFLSATISAIKLVECSCVLLGRIILSPLLLLVKNYKLGEKYSPQTIHMSSPGLTDLLLVTPRYFSGHPPLQKCWRWVQKSSVPCSRALGTAASYPLS